MRIPLAEIREVLAGRRSLAESARTLTVRESAVLGAVILHGVGKTNGFNHKEGTLGDLLQELVVAPGISTDSGWPKYTEEGEIRYPAWYDAKSGPTLRAALRHCGLTTSRGGALELPPRRAITMLLEENPIYVERAQVWYDQMQERRRKRQATREWQEARLVDARNALRDIATSSGSICVDPERLYGQAQLHRLISDLQRIATLFDEEE